MGQSHRLASKCGLGVILFSLGCYTMYGMDGLLDWMMTMQLQPFWQKRLELTCQDDCMPLVGESSTVGQSQVLQELHQSAHPGATRMKRIARTLVWWYGIDKDIVQEVKSCSECQRNQASLLEAPVQPWHWPTPLGPEFMQTSQDPSMAKWCSSSLSLMLIRSGLKPTHCHPSLRLLQFDVVDTYLQPLVYPRSW